MTVADITFTGGGIRDTDVATGAGIQATKLEHQQSMDAELFDESTTVAALASRLLHISYAAGTIVAFEGIITTQATGADRTVNVDLQKSTGGGAFASITTTDIEIDNTTTIRVPVAAVLSSTGLVDGDILRAVVSVAGSADAQAIGLLVTLTIREDPS